MDKFDELIRNSMDKKEPSKNFVEDTMRQIHASHSKRLLSWKLWLPALTGALALLAVLVVLPLSTRDASSKTATMHNSSSIPAKGAASGHQEQVAAIPAGTDNATLSSDLSSLGSNIYQESADQNSANSNLNDSQQQIAIPTD